MPPSLALLLWLLLLLALWRWDPAKEADTSGAVWVPLASMFFLASRLPSQWTGIGGAASAADAYQEGSSFDRTILFALIVLAIVILFWRSFQCGNFLARNIALTAFLSFAFISFLWSDYPFVSLKRWVRDVGSYTTLLIVLTEARPVRAAQTLLRRLFYLTIPLSIVLIKYYPPLGRGYSPWTGAAYYQGVATSKNMLGVLCMLSGLFFFADTLARWGSRTDSRTAASTRTIAVNLTFVAMTVWLLNLAHSATSNVCLGIGCGIVAAAHSRLFKHRPRRLAVLVPIGLCLYLVLEVSFGINELIVQAVGRDPTLTDRTEIWQLLLSMRTNPIVGTGYESFWLGARLQRVWLAFKGVNEAHNGYLEIYLNLGAVGLFLLLCFLVAKYRRISQTLESESSFASFALALWTILLFYNVTEAAFKTQLLWATFWVVAAAVPGRFQRLATKGDTVQIGRQHQRVVSVLSLYRSRRPPEPSNDIPCQARVSCSQLTSRSMSPLRQQRPRSSRLGGNSLSSQNGILSEDGRADIRGNVAGGSRKAR